MSETTADDAGPRHAAPQQPPPDEPATAPPEGKRRGFPTPFGILGIVVLLVWLATFVIPAGLYQRDDTGAPIAGSYSQTDSPLSAWEQVQQLLMSPVNGLYGIRDAETGFVGPFNSGTMFGGVQVFLFILAIGGFMTVVFRTGALDLGIAHLAHRYRTRGAVLIIVLSLLFGLLGSVMSWSDETLGFYALMIPLMLSLGYDRMVAVAVVTVAPFVGIVGSTVNPFRTGAGADAAGVSIGDGIGLRIAILVLGMAAMIWYTLRYARRVRAEASTSVVGIDAADAEVAAQGAADDLPPLTRTHKAVIGLVAFTFALLTFSIIPWGAILNNTAADETTHETVVDPFPWELGWWLPELTVLFIVMALIIGVAARLGEKGTVGAFLKGVADFSGPASLVLLAKAVSVLLTNTQTIDTVLHAMGGMVSGTSNAVFALLLSVGSLPLAFLVGSGAAGNALVMPILAPLGDFASIDRSLIVTTYNAVGAWLNLILPINAILVAGLALARVGFNTYVRWMLPLMGILAAIILAVILVGVAL